jgi:sugar O-acyltransferase (sialic acid O-acetyltransferase NeuD family)
MPKQLVILGTSGSALDILDVVDALNADTQIWEVVGFLDDSRPRGSAYEEWEILGGVREAAKFPGVLFINSIGSDRSYRKRAEILASTGLPLARFTTLVHPTAAISKRARLGPGTCANAGVCVWLGAGCVLGHDAVVEDYSLIAPQAVLSGAVQVGPSVYVGAGACVRQRVTIGERALVGAGGVVITDVAAGTTVVGNPARVLVRHGRSGQTADTPPPSPGLHASFPKPTGSESGAE